MRTTLTSALLLLALSAPVAAFAAPEAVSITITCKDPFVAMNRTVAPRCTSVVTTVMTLIPGQRYSRRLIRQSVYDRGPKVN